MKNKHPVLRRFMRRKVSVVAAAVLILFVLIAILGPLVWQVDPLKQSVMKKYGPMTVQHPLGTDNLGRDTLARMIYGARVSLAISFAGVLSGALIGVLLGVSAGYFGGWVDKVLLFITDVTWCVPGTILALAVVTVLGKGLTNSIIAISLVGWAGYARTVRAKTMSLRTMAFVETGRAFGESSLSLMFRYILPNIVPSLIVLISNNLPGTIMATTTLSFLGLGSQPPSPDWGLAISQGMNYVHRAQWLSIFPGLALVYTVLGFNILGEGMRDLLDPRLKVLKGGNT